MFIKPYAVLLQEKQASYEKWSAILARREEVFPDETAFNEKLRLRLATAKSSLDHLLEIGEEGYLREQEEKQAAMRQSNAAFLRDELAPRYPAGSLEQQWVLKMAEEQERSIL